MYVIMQGPRTKFLDTMSLHVCVAGQTASQKMIWQKVSTVPFPDGATRFKKIHAVQQE